MQKVLVRYLMAALMTVTLIWGGCLSCSQYFMLPLQAARNCCKLHGSCKEKQGKEIPGSRQSDQQCNLQAVALSTTKAPDTTTQPAHAFIVLPSESTLLHVALRHDVCLRIRPDRGSPPDLNLLHSILRV